MNPDQLKAFRETLVAAQFDPGRPAFAYPYQRGFNEGVSLAILNLDKIMGETNAIQQQ